MTKCRICDEEIHQEYMPINMCTYGTGIFARSTQMKKVTQLIWVHSAGGAQHSRHPKYHAAEPKEEAN